MNKANANKLSIIAWLVIVLLFSTCKNLSAQFTEFKVSVEQDEKCSINGYIHSNILGASIPIEGAAISVTSENDTISITSRTGNFIIKGLSPGIVSLNIFKQGYSRFNEKITLEKGELFVSVELYPAVDTISASKVIGEVPLYTFRGDTLVYNAELVQKFPGDFAIDLIRKLPGAEVGPASVSFGGVTVSRAYVNGILVFGRNPMDALNNVSANEVMEFQVYDESSPFKVPSSDDNPVRVVNLKTRHKILEASDIQVAAFEGINADEYRGTHKAKADFFSEELILKTKAESGNLGQNSEELAPLSNSRKNKHAEFSLEKYWGTNLITRNGLHLNYIYNDDSMTQEKQSHSSYLGAINIPEREVNDSTSTRNKNNNHTWEYGGIYTIRNRIRLSLNGNTAISGNSTITKQNLNTFIESYDALKENLIQNQNNRGWSSRNSISMYDLEKPLSCNLSASVKNGTDTGSIIDSTVNSVFQRNLNMRGERKSSTLSFTSQYSFDLSRSWNLFTRYSFDYNKLDNSQLSYDLIDDAEKEMNWANSWNYSFHHMHSSVMLQIRNKNTSFQVMPRIDFLRLKDILYSENNEKLYFSLLPAFNTHLFNGKMNFNLSSSPMLPSVEQMRNTIVDDSHQSHIYKGNPNLKRSITYSVSIQLKNKNNNLLDVPLQASINLATNPIVPNETFYETDAELSDMNNYRIHSGTIVSSYSNADWSLDALLQHSKNDFKRQTSFNALLNYGYNAKLGITNRPSFVQGEKVRVSSIIPSLNANASISFSDWFESYLNIGLDYRMMSNKDTRTVLKAFSPNINSTTTIHPGKHSKFTSAYSYTGTRELTSGISNSYHFLKLAGSILMLDNKLELSLNCVDLMNHSKQISNLRGENSIRIETTPSYGTYYLISVKYRFNTTQSKVFLSSF